MVNFLSDEEIEQEKIIPSEVFAKINVKLAEKAVEVEEKLKEIALLETKLAYCKDQLKHLQEEDMPALMDAMDVSSVTLTNGTVVTLDSSLHASINNDTKDLAFQWLKDNDFGDLIKTELNVKFNRFESNMLPEIKDKVEELKLAYSEKAMVHPMTLKAWAKEQMKEGKQLPAELFGIFIKRVVNIKKGKI